MIHTVYKTVNKINNMEYIGVHSTEDINDKYFGSGKYLKRAIKKYGISNFKKEILFILETKEECYIKERELVTEEYIKRDSVYNIKPGGYGSLNLKWTDEQKLKIKGLHAGVKNPNFGNGYKQKGSNNGRHKDNFKGNINEVGNKISKALKLSTKNKKENNNASKKYYAYNGSKYFDLKEGYLREFCEDNNLKYITMYNTLKTNKPVSKGPSKGWQLFKGSIND